MGKKRDDIEWPPVTERIRMVDEYGEIMTPGRRTLWQYLRWFFLG
jgi:hypothetical protein